ncbi:MAG: DNA polymerase III subunit gamma/tau [Buchnera aphidicola (Nurudea yanoniella)]
MNYKILANKWRPQEFNSVIGQKYIISAICNGLKLKRIHHTWLFHGIRGTGKTTIARLLAKSLSCEQKITQNPCRKCSNCKEIEKGKFIDLFEVDAASHTKVEDMKELLENVYYLPIKGRFKIYLIDEVHMLSKNSFNALLKIIEEPPNHIKFILATTNLEKVPKTILSRCLNFQLRPISFTKIIKKIEHILSQEHIFFEYEAIKLLSIESEGSLRDTLNLIEQAISIGNGKILTKIVQNMLGKLDNTTILNIILALLKKDFKKMFLLFQYIQKLDINWENILTEILKLLYQIAMIQTFPTINKDYLFFENQEINKKIYEISKISKFSDIQLYYKTILTGKKELCVAPSFRIGVEMTLLRALNLNIKSITTNIDDIKDTKIKLCKIKK